MRVAACLLAPCVVAAAACTTFAFPSPNGTASDASVDAAPLPGFLDVGSAAGLCSLLFQCPGLAAAIEGSLVVPLDTPSSELNFSGCMDWLAAPVDPARPGLAKQKQILGAIAGATSCPAAFAAAPVQPAAGTCSGSGTSCDDAGLLQGCAASGPYTVSCGGSPVFGAPGTCQDFLGTPSCVSSGACTDGVSCDDAGDLVECVRLSSRYTSISCTLSGRTCASAGTGLGACAAPGTLAPPCVGNETRSDTCRADDAGTPGLVVLCDSTASQTEFACPPVGKTCSTASGVARCVGPHDACSALGTDMNVCSGSALTVCVDGAKTTVDCASIPGHPGLSCIPTNGALSGHCG